MSIEALKEECSNCRFALKSNYNDQHHCRRRSPVADQVSACNDLREWVPRFPIMRGADWCGEFEQASAMAGGLAEGVSDGK